MNKPIHWLPEEEYQKAKTQLAINVGVILQPLSRYGQQVYVDQALPEIIKLCEDFGLRVRGVNKIISLELMRKHQISK
jgi:hypothetical protein